MADSIGRRAPRRPGRDGRLRLSQSDSVGCSVSVAKSIASVWAGLHAAGIKVEWPGMQAPPEMLGQLKKWSACPEGFARAQKAGTWFGAYATATGDDLRWLFSKLYITTTGEGGA